MSEINNITELLNSQESEEAIDALFKKHEKDFFTKKDVRMKFGSNLKSAILLDYFKSHNVHDFLSDKTIWDIDLTEFADLEDTFVWRCSDGYVVNKA